MNTQNKYSNEGLHHLARSCQFSGMTEFIERIDAILHKEMKKVKLTGFTYEEGIALDEFVEMLATKTKTDKFSSVDIVVVTCKNFVSFVEAKLKVGDADNVSHKEMLNKISGTRNLMNSCDFPKQINQFTHVLLDDIHYQQNVSKLRNKMSNDPKIIPWKVSDFLRFIREDMRI